MMMVCKSTLGTHVHYTRTLSPATVDGSSCDEFFGDRAMCGRAFTVVYFGLSCHVRLLDTALQGQDKYDHEYDDEYDE
eukprot:m.228725 g.228725  ORF g.228725 m.228725 type:complete len:78 (-) comp15192_c0_seq20:744-977(-)